MSGWELLGLVGVTVLGGIGGGFFGVMVGAAVTLARRDRRP